MSLRLPDGRLLKIKSGFCLPALTRPETVDTLKADMLAGRFRYAAGEARICGWVLEHQHEVIFYVSDGHHRINAALEIYRETGNREFLDRLLTHGDWEPGLPSRPGRLPTRSFSSRIWTIWYRFRTLAGF